MHEGEAFKGGDPEPLRTVAAEMTSLTIRAAAAANVSIGKSEMQGPLSSSIEASSSLATAVCLIRSYTLHP